MDDHKQRRKLSREMLITSICFGLTYLFVMGVMIKESAIIPGLDKGKDQEKKNAIIKINRLNCKEGLIIDHNGDAITEKVEEKNSAAVMIYPYSYAWLLGTFREELKTTGGIRYLYQDKLFDRSLKDRGQSLQLTTINDMQNYAYRLLDSISDDGSIIIVENKSGAIRALASRGEVVYNGNNQIEFSNEASQTKDGLLFRGISEQDAPASTFKLVTLAAALESKAVDINDKKYQNYDDSGVFEYQDGHNLTNYNGAVYGNIDLQEALNNSVNTYFAMLSASIPYEDLNNIYQKYYLGKEIDLDFSSNKLISKYELQDDIRSKTYAGIGQGSMQITPLHLTMIIASFGNDGKMMQPYAVEKIGDKLSKAKVLSQAISKENADLVKQYAHNSALSYGFDEASCGYVSAKTGTCEFENEKKHSYIVAFNEQYTFMISCNDIETSAKLVAPMKELLMKYRP